MSHSYWTALLLVALGSQLFRLTFLGRRLTPALPGPVRRALDHVPTAVLAALLVPEFISANPDWAAVAAAVAAIVAALVTRKDFLAIVAGLIVYWLLI
ncbi:MAG: AzlD domain-containing protein [Deltaproteobacteria bacterium]|jgi:branched-subunit amino acid transport protein|nr:AzlD domain-containing protein [Deltaproteobacteria bacterium]